MWCYRIRNLATCQADRMSLRKSSFRSLLISRYQDNWYRDRFITLLYDLCTACSVQKSTDQVNARAKEDYDMLKKIPSWHLCFMWPCSLQQVELLFYKILEFRQKRKKKIGGGAFLNWFFNAMLSMIYYARILDVKHKIIQQGVFDFI